MVSHVVTSSFGLRLNDFGCTYGQEGPSQDQKQQPV